MSKIVFDSSALIALLGKEKGHDFIEEHIKDAIISTVNVAEVYKYCVENEGLSEDNINNLMKMLDVKIVDFCNEQALISASLINETKKYGLSLGDRACIALAIHGNHSIITCDRVWKNLNVGIEFMLAR